MLERKKMSSQQQTSKRYTLPQVLGGVAAGALAGALAAVLVQKSRGASAAKLFSLANQPERFAMQQATNDAVAMRIESVYEPSLLAGKRVLVTGCNRGLGLAIATELKTAGASVVAAVRKSSAELVALDVAQIIEGCEMTSDAAIDAMVAAVDAPLDVVINNAGYFRVEKESVLSGTMDFADEVKTIDICAVALLRVSAKLFSAGKIATGGKLVMITSQGGSIAWRDVQSGGGAGDYGHHMSKAAANMGSKLLALELKEEGIIVGILHPGFNRTAMTSKYAHIYDIEGAVPATTGAKRVCHQINLLTIERTGDFINCEDGRLIPW